MGENPGCNNIQILEEQTVLQNYLHNKDKGIREETIFFIFRLNIVPHASYQADQNLMEIQEWKEKVPDNFVKSFSRVLLLVLETSIVS